MVDKPKTYPQKVAELQEELQLKSDRIAKLESQVDLIPTLQAEIESLKSAVAPRPVDNKAQLVDIEARAVAAEKQIKSMLAKWTDANRTIEGLQQQLDIAGAERDKNLGKDSKIEQLSETVKSQNMQIASFNLAISDVRREATEQIAKYEKQIHTYQQLAERQGILLGNLFSIINSAPDIVSDLKRIAARGL